MIPKYQGDVARETPTTNNSGGSRSRGGKQQQGYDNLTINDLSDTPRDAEILGTLVEEQVRFDKKQSVVLLKLSLNGEIRIWTLTVNNPNLETLTNAFGENESDWDGNIIQLRISKPTFKGQKWPEVSSVGKVEKKAAKKGR